MDWLYLFWPWLFTCILNFEHGVHIGLMFLWFVLRLAFCGPNVHVKLWLPISCLSCWVRGTVMPSFMFLFAKVVGFWLWHDFWFLRPAYAAKTEGRRKVGHWLEGESRKENVLPKSLISQDLNFICWILHSFSCADHEPVGVEFSRTSSFYFATCILFPEWLLTCCLSTLPWAAG